MHTLVIILATAFACVTASAQELKGLTLGQSMASAVEELGGAKRCINGVSTTSCHMLASDAAKTFQTFAGHPADGLALGAVGDKLGSIYISFGNGPYDDIKAALVQKYGPTTCEDSATSNVMGVTFKQQNCGWDFDNGATIRMQRICGKINIGCLNLSSKAWLEDFTARTKRDQTKAVNDL